MHRCGAADARPGLNDKVAVRDASCEIAGYSVFNLNQICGRVIVGISRCNSSLNVEFTGLQLHARDPTGQRGRNSRGSVSIIDDRSIDINAGRAAGCSSTEVDLQRERHGVAGLKDERWIDRARCAGHPDLGEIEVLLNDAIPAGDVKESRRSQLDRSDHVCERVAAGGRKLGSPVGSWGIVHSWPCEQPWRWC